MHVVVWVEVVVFHVVENVVNEDMLGGRGRPVNLRIHIWMTDL